MCWSTEATEHHSPKIANTDLYVLKILSFYTNNLGKMILKSPFYSDMKWRFNKIYKTKLGKPYKPIFSTTMKITKGFHCFRTDVPSSYLCHYMGINTCIMMGVIPGGSTYYENEYGEIVTNQLKILRPIKSEMR